MQIIAIMKNNNFLHCLNYVEMIGLGKASVSQGILIPFLGISLM